MSVSEDNESAAAAVGKEAAATAARAVVKKGGGAVLLKVGFPVVLIVAGLVLLLFIGLVIVLVIASAGGSSTTAPCVVDDDQLSVAGASSSTAGLDEQQRNNAAQIVSVGRSIGANDRALTIALMTAFQESNLRVLANDRVPASLNLPHEGVGSDHDSLSLFQQRPGWGGIADRMDVDYTVRAFFGGPDGPNHGSPRGLFDVRGWEVMGLGEAAQTVQVSAFPSAYAKWEDEATALVAELSGMLNCSSGGTIGGEIALPLKGDMRVTSGFGPRNLNGKPGWHQAVDLVPARGTVCGVPVYAIRPGEVIASYYMFLTVRDSDGYTVSYLHMYQADRTVKVGDFIQAGQQVGLIGDEGSATGESFGCHLDLRINGAGNTNPAIAALPTAGDSGAQGFRASYIDPFAYIQLYGLSFTG